MPLHIQGEVVPLPKGQKVLRGSMATDADYAVVGDCYREIPNGKTFKITKIALSCDQDAIAKITYGDEDISIEYVITAKIPVTDWFAENEKAAVGDGTKTLQIEGKYPSGGSTGTLGAELIGQEV